MTPNKEDYLKCIHELGLHGSKISNKQIAAYMQVSAPSVSEMVKKLISENLIVRDSEIGYKPTDVGQHLIDRLYRKHRLIEVFLMHHLHYTADQIHEEAEVLEHTVSERFIDRLEELLDFPTFCPHGGTIPKKGESLVEYYQKTLAQASRIGSYSLVRIHDYYQLLHYLDQHHLTIGDCIELIRIDHFAQTFEVSYKGQSLSIPKSIAQQLYIEPIHS